MSIRAEIARVSTGQNPEPPARLGRRFNKKKFLPEAGNTLVCHLDQTDPAHEPVLTARARINALPGAENILNTPISSLHMTVFEGAIDSRRSADAWPAGLDLCAPIDTVTQILAERLETFAPPAPFRVKATGIRPAGLVLSGATPEDEAAMHIWRERLTEPFGYRHKNHDAYRFHMTFGYLTDWIADDVQELWITQLHAILEELVRDAPIIPLQPPAFCTFADMTHFEKQVILTG